MPARKTQSGLIDRATLDSMMFVALRDNKTKLIKNINTIHDLNIGCGTHTCDVIISGKTECRGAAVLTGGAIGALKLPGGAPAIIAGDNVIVAYNNNNTVTITASVSAGELGAQLDALETLVDQLDASLNETSALVSTFDARITAVSGSVVTTVSSVSAVSGTLSTLNNSFSTLSGSFVTTRDNVSAMSGTLSTLNNSFSTLSGSVVTINNNLNALTDIVSTLQNASGLNAALTMNETPSGTINGSNKIFSLLNAPFPASSLMLFLNGQLLTPGENSDFTLSSSTITLSSTINAPKVDDVLRSMYSYQTSVTSYSINELITIQGNNPNYFANTLNAPNPPSTLMLFLNGQLLTAGVDNDYQLTGARITLGAGLHIPGETIYYATYSY